MDEDNGWPIDAYLGHHFLLHAHPDNRHNSTSQVDALISAEKPDSRFDVCHRSQNETWRWLDFYCAALKDEAGHVIGVSGTIDDVTERKSEQDALHRAATLQHAILESAPFSVVATDLVGTIQLVNPATEPLLGYHRSELLGRKNILRFRDSVALRSRGDSLKNGVGEIMMSAFETLTARASQGAIEDREWT